LAVLDCGVKYNILRHFESRGCECVVLPIDQAKEALATQQFHGLFISNGPGDPEPVQAAIDIIQSQFGQLPIFGICLGHQLIAQALGGSTYKMSFGHHGINHPVKNLETGRVEITSQNHGFCVDVDSLGEDVIVTHVNLYDGTNEGFKHTKFPLFSVQYHPEAAPGPCDSDYLFDEFIQMMEAAYVTA
jgi:carbamoyl-phosphate synthase small subunit